MSPIPDYVDYHLLVADLRKAAEWASQKDAALFHRAARRIEALEAQAEGMPDVGVYAIATGVYTKDECERKWAEIFNGPAP